MVMMRMTTTTLLLIIDSALFFRTSIFAGFDFNSHMLYAMFFELFPNKSLYILNVIVGNNVNRGAIYITIKSPHVKMVNILNPANGLYVFRDFFNICINRRLFQKHIDRILDILKCVNQNENTNSNGHNGVYDCKIGKLHY